MSGPKRPRGMTLAEHDALLQATGDYQPMLDRQRQQEEARLRVEQEVRRAEVPLISELTEAGLAISTIWDLVNVPLSYDRVLPILLEHLQRPYPAVVREGIARTLAVPQARFAWGTLTRLFENETERRVKDGLACCLSACSDDSTLDDIIALVKDERHSQSRVLLLSALARSNSPKAKAALVDFAKTADLKKEVERILRQLNPTRRKVRH